MTSAIPTEEWELALLRISKWLSGRGQEQHFGTAVVAPPEHGELTDADREELEGRAIERWATKRQTGDAYPRREAARALDNWRRRQRRRRRLGLTAMPEPRWAEDAAFDDEPEAYDPSPVDSTSPESVVLAVIDDQRAATAEPRPTRPVKAKPGPGSRVQQANAWVNQVSRRDPERALRWLRCLDAVASLTRVPLYGVGGQWLAVARAAALEDIRRAFAQTTGKRPEIAAQAVLRALGCPPATAKNLLAFRRVARGRQVKCSPTLPTRAE